MPRRRSSPPFLPSPSLVILAALVAGGVLTPPTPRASTVLPPSALAPAGLSCEAAANPVGVDAAQPELSWQLVSPRRGDTQQAWQILVASDPVRLANDEGDLWNSGRVESTESLHIPYRGRPCPPSRQAWWKVRVWDGAGHASPWSTNATWTTGLPSPSHWQAKWITLRSDPTNGLPLFRREFTLPQSVAHAVVHVSGLGHYELTLDGQPVGDRFLDPAWSAYESTVYYATYDLTDRLRSPGPHTFGIQLGKGFYRTAGDRRVHGVNSTRPLQFILQAELHFADGSTTRILSDAGWRGTPGPITHSAILGGEDHDARRLPVGWNLTGFKDTHWTPATEAPGPGGRLKAAVAPPMGRLRMFAAVRVDEPAPGVFVYDFGQNAAAIPRLRVRGRAGQVLRLTPAEQRQGMSPRRNDGRGLVDPAGVGRPCYFQYTLRGDAEETWSPQFTYSGFQYLQVEGAIPAGHANPGGLPEVVELASIQIGSRAERVGTFACSDPLFNDIDRTIDWAVYANLAHVLTDCPHREKLGWLEVSYLMGPSIAGRFDIARLYDKIADDCADAQSPDGRVPTVAPAYPAFGGGFAYTPEWGAAAVVNPWLLYEWYGDRRTLERHFPAMRAFVDYLHATATDLVPVPGLGDWYDYGHGKPVGASQFTPPELSAMATFHRCARIVADTARILGRADVAEHYRILTESIARRFEARWFRAPDAYENHGSPQTANSMALVSGIVGQDRTPAVLGAVVRDLEHRGYQQTAGDIGHAYLLQALARYGRSDVIDRIASRTNIGSYGFIVHNGWTSMPEAWDADTGASMNHCMLGHIQEWFLGWVAGIRPDPDPSPATAGFRRFLVEPHPLGHLDWAAATFDGPRGRIACRWEKQPGGLLLELTVPHNSTARVRLPASPQATLRDATPGVSPTPPTVLARDPEAAYLEVGGGTYQFEVVEKP